jgi:N-acetylmuramic acid 6-phosphate (MurNAc-6-P) etherase
VGNVAPGGIFDGGGLPFVMAPMKKALAENGVPFGIVGAEPCTPGYAGRDETVFTIVVSAAAAKAAKSEDVEAGEYRLTLAHTAVRERQANDVLVALGTPGTSSIGPVYLSQVPTKSGNNAWSIASEPSDEPVTNIGDGGGDAADGSPSDDGIPY